MSSGPLNVELEMGPMGGCCCTGGFSQDHLSGTHHAKGLLAPILGQSPVTLDVPVPGWSQQLCPRAYGTDALQGGAELCISSVHFLAPLLNQTLGHRFWVSQGCPQQDTVGRVRAGGLRMTRLSLMTTWVLSVNLLLSFLFLRGCRL